MSLPSSPKLLQLKTHLPNSIPLLPSFPRNLGFREFRCKIRRRVYQRSLLSQRKIGGLNGLRRFEIKARTAASKTIEVEVDKPLGLTLGQKQGGELSSPVWKEVGTQQKLGLNLEIKFCTQVATLEMSFGLHHKMLMDITMRRQSQSQPPNFEFSPPEVPNFTENTRQNYERFMLEERRGYDSSTPSYSLNDVTRIQFQQNS